MYEIFQNRYHVNFWDPTEIPSSAFIIYILYKLYKFVIFNLRAIRSNVVFDVPLGRRRYILKLLLHEKSFTETSKTSPYHFHMKQEYREVLCGII